MFFPANTKIRARANFVLLARGIETGEARLRENKIAARKFSRLAVDLIYKAPGAKRGTCIACILGGA